MTRYDPLVYSQPIHIRELALVTTPSSNISSTTERQLGGGLDTLTLSSLYDEGAYRASQRPIYGAPASNPFEVHDPFAMSNNIAAPHAVQMTAMSQPPPPNPFGPFQPTYPQPTQQQQLMMNPANPFIDSGFGSAFHAHPVSHPQANNNNPFGSPGHL